MVLSRGFSSGFLMQLNRHPDPAGIPREGRRVDAEDVPVPREGVLVKPTRGLPRVRAVHARGAVGRVAPAREVRGVGEADDDAEAEEAAQGPARVRDDCCQVEEASTLQGVSSADGV